MSKKKTSTGEITFRPHKVEFICVSVIFVFILLLSLWLAFLMGPVIYIAFLPLLIIMAFLEYYEFLYSALQITINEQMVIIENLWSKKTLTAKWTDFQNAYLLQDIKANRFMLLTPNTLSYEEQKNCDENFTVSANHTYPLTNPFAYTFPITWRITARHKISFNIKSPITHNQMNLVFGSNKKSRLSSAFLYINYCAFLSFSASPNSLTAL